MCFSNSVSPTNRPAAASYCWSLYPTDFAIVPGLSRNKHSGDCNLGGYLVFDVSLREVAKPDYFIGVLVLCDLFIMN